MFTTFLIFHLVNFLLKHHRLQSLHQTLYRPSLSFTTIPSLSPWSTTCVNYAPYSPCQSPLPTTSFLQDPSLMLSKDMGCLSSHITCMKLSQLTWGTSYTILSILKQHNRECLQMEASYLVVRTLVARRKVVQRMNNLRFIFHFHQGIMKRVLNRLNESFNFPNNSVLVIVHVWKESIISNLKIKTFPEQKQWLPWLCEGQGRWPHPPRR